MDLENAKDWQEGDDALGWWMFPRAVRELFACMGITLFLYIVVLQNVVLIDPGVKLAVCFFVAVVVFNVLFVIEYYLRLKQISAQIKSWSKSVDELVEEVELMQQEIVERIDEISTWDEQELDDYRQSLSDENRDLLDSLLEERRQQ